MKFTLVALFRHNAFPADRRHGFDLSFSKRVVVARLASQEIEDCDIKVPAEALGDAKIGDEFTVYFERVNR